MLEKLKGALAKRPSKRIAFFVDGPNMIRKEFNIDLVSVKKKLEKHGTIKVCKVFLDQYASDKLIEAVTNQGYEPIISTGDVDITLAVDAMSQVFNQNIDVIAIMSRDIDFTPVLVKAKSMGKETIILGAEPGFSAALRNTADLTIMLP